MVPVSLQLKNFTSYGESPVLDFTRFHMAAISGLNGVGKSSLLVSMTWCLWGSSRAGDSSDALIRLGQTQMSVEFSFKLDGHIYTVKRSRKLNSTTNLEFWSQTHNLTEGTIKATQQKIIDTLHLSFDTFVNSAYIRQGHADEFTTKGATERKRILADILGLSRYDQLEEKAKEKAKAVQDQLKLLEYQLLEIEAELSMKDQREKEVSLARLECDQAEKELLEIEHIIREIELKREVASSKYQSLQEKAQRIMSTKKEIADIQIQIGLKVRAKQEHQIILDQKQEIEKNCILLSSLQDQKKALETKRSELIQVKDELVNIQKVLRDREEKRTKAITDLEIQVKKLETENKGYQTQIDHLTSHKDICPTCNQVIGEKTNQEIITKNKNLLESNQKQLADLSEKISKYKATVLPEQAQVEQK